MKLQYDIDTTCCTMEKNLTFSFLAAYAKLQKTIRHRRFNYNLVCAVLLNGKCISIETNSLMFHAEVNAFLGAQRMLKNTFNSFAAVDGKDRYNSS
jgi:hypothetical protein